MRVVLPDATAEFPFPAERLTREDVWGPWADIETEKGRALLDIRVVRGEADFVHPDLDVERFDNTDSSDLSLGFAVFKEAQVVVAGVVHEFVEWVRVTGKQPWIGPSPAAPQRGGPMQLLDLDRQERFPIGFADSGAVLIKPVSSALSLGDLADVEQALKACLPPPTPESFLLDARYFAFHGDPPSMDRGLLLAAIAAEVKIKETLRTKIAPSRQQLLDSLVGSFRPVAHLLDRPYAGALGRSLKAEDRPLFERIEQLFRLRNRLAHHGDSPDHDEAREVILAADALFTWLDELPAQIDIA